MNSLWAVIADECFPEKLSSICSVDEWFRKMLSFSYKSNYFKFEECICLLFVLE